ncbi:MAG: PfkB family carbohydrate kinase [Candidatus Undinarchaeales archaeon]|jgi:ribokinase|nr:PfkB family carbohydrate kinase [Candidatus Undinarchaeales archaeon]MDP7492320.1 PfkB family carbohydrate kinase [Candidatus Undinarchaeales archaeon]
MVKVCVIGAINWDINYFVDHLPAPGEEVLVERKDTCPGGTGANVATAAARLMATGEVAMLGGLGRDDIAQSQRTLMATEGIDTEGILTLDAESGQAHITIDAKGENTIVTVMGANALVTPENLHIPAIERLLWEAKVVVITDPPLESIPTIVELAGDAVLVWDPGVRVAEAGSSLLKRMDYLVLNEVEAKGLSPEVVQQTAIIEKLGKAGCRFTGSEGTIEAPGVDLAALELEVVNTVGCGDAFLGAFAASIASGLDVNESLARANLAGAINASRAETRGSPTAKELDEALNPPEEEA